MILNLKNLNKITSSSQIFPLKDPSKLLFIHCDIFDHYTGLQFIDKGLAAVSCSLNTPRLGGVGFGSGLTGKLGRAWVGAWVVHGVGVRGVGVRGVRVHGGWGLG